MSQASNDFVALAGDVMLSSGLICYMGAFINEYRQEAVKVPCVPLKCRIFRVSPESVSIPSPVFPLNDSLFRRRSGWNTAPRIGSPPPSITAFKMSLEIQS